MQVPHILIKKNLNLIKFWYLLKRTSNFYVTKGGVIPYNIITRTVSGGEDAIFFMLWRKNEGGTKTISVVKMYHFTISLWHTSAPILISWYQLTYFDALSSHSVKWQPYPGYRIAEEVYMKYKYIELCCSYAGPHIFYNKNDNLGVIKFSSLNRQFMLSVGSVPFDNLCRL
jgi:hypothetical protein